MNYSELLPGYMMVYNGTDLQSVLQTTTVDQITLTNNRVKKLYTLGDKNNEHIILLPPVGMSFLLVSKLAKTLSQNYFVLCWESVGCPDISERFEDGQESLSYQIEELTEILCAKNISEFHFVGWCQACQKLMKFCPTTANSTLKSITLLAPAGLGTSLLDSEFGRCALPIYLQMAARDEKFASQMSAILGANKKPEATEHTSGELISLAHLQDPKTSIRFAKYMLSFDKERKNIDPQKYQLFLTTPTHIIHCKDDEFSHYSESVQLSKRIPSLHLSLLSKGGHLMMFNQPDAAAELIHKQITKINDKAVSSEPLQA